jgi:DNA-binding CsgD family transcriptional regulator
MTDDHQLFIAKIVTTSDWKKFKSQFENEYPFFYSQLHKKHPGLSPAELRLVTLIKLKYNIGKISEILCVDPKSIIKLRYRLKKKLNMQENLGLEEWVEAIEK